MLGGAIEFQDELAGANNLRGSEIGIVF